VKFLLPPNKKIYFASDLHLSIAPDVKSLRREKEFVQWLNTVKNDAAAIFLLGDMFDFWFEYRHVVPRGFIRLLGKLAELTDEGIPVHFFIGNHDQWLRDYLRCEMNIHLYREPAEFSINEKLFLVGHGNITGMEQIVERTINFVFGNRILRRLFAMLHPFWGFTAAIKWSEHARKRRGLYKPFIGPEYEPIYLYAQNKLAEKHVDFFVFGHRHLAMDMRLNENSRYINTGEWIKAQSYAVFDGNDVTLHSFKASFQRED